MSDLFWLTDAQMARLEPYFPKSHGKPRVDDRRVLSGIIFINRIGILWRDAPAEYGPHKTHYNRWKRWSDKGIFAQMMAGLGNRRRKDRPEGLLHQIRYDRAVLYEQVVQRARAQCKSERLCAVEPGLEDVAERLGVGG